MAFVKVVKNVWEHNFVLWYNLNFGLGKGVNPFLIRASSRALKTEFSWFGLNSNFHIETSKSVNLRVVCYLREHNLLHWWHFKFRVEDIQNLGQSSAAQFHQVENSANFSPRSRLNHNSFAMSTFKKV